MNAQWSKIWIFLLVVSMVIVSAEEARSWCWLRDTGDSACSSGGFQQTCCSGNLQKWQASGMTYQISNSTDASLLDYIRTGTNLWTNIEMATFVFTEGARTAAYDFALSDGVNVINIDAQFCTHNPSDCNQGVLGGSACRTSGAFAVECDVVLNGEEFTWGDGTNGTQSTVSTIAHEVGHNAGLTHPGSVCRDQGSSGCGPDVVEANMFWEANSQQINTANLELDDVASLVYGYPRSTFRVRVMQGSAPVSGATVELIGTSAPVNGTDIASGGKVYGDVSSAYLFGDKTASATYVAQTPFSATDADGYTNYINPIHRSFQVRVTKEAVTETYEVTVQDGTSTGQLNLESSANSYLLWTK